VRVNHLPGDNGSRQALSLGSISDSPSQHHALAGNLSAYVESQTGIASMPQNQPIETTVEFLASQHESLPSASEETAAKPVANSEMPQFAPPTVSGEIGRLGKYRKIAEYRKKGWRPHIVSVHSNREDVKFLAVFIENKANDTWEFTANLSVADYETQLIERKSKGQRPRCVASHITDSKVSYTVVWDRVPAGK